MSKGSVSLYESLANRVWERMVGLVGIHAVAILVKRAVWMTQQKQPRAHLIRHDDNGISFAAFLVEDIDPEEVKCVAEEFFSSLFSILTRLVGLDITKKLTKELDCLVPQEEGAT